MNQLHRDTLGKAKRKSLGNRNLDDAFELRVSHARLGKVRKIPTMEVFVQYD